MLVRSHDRRIDQDVLDFRLACQSIRNPLPRTLASPARETDGVPALYRPGVLLLLVPPRVAPHSLFLGNACGSSLAESTDAFVCLPAWPDRQADWLSDVFRTPRVAWRASGNRACDAEF